MTVLEAFGGHRADSAACMEYLNHRSAQYHSPGQPAGRRAPVSHHMPLSGMVPDCGLPNGDFGRGWQGHGKLELPLAEVQAQSAPCFTPFRGQQRFGSNNAFDSHRTYGGRSLANATQAPESMRSMLTSPPASQRWSRETTPRMAAVPGRALPARAVAGGTYSSTLRDVDSVVNTPPGLRSHYDVQSLAQPTTDRFKQAVGGVVPVAQTHCGNSHVGNAAPSQREQRGHGEQVVRMAQQAAVEVAGDAATHVAAASIPGHKGHLDVGAFGTSHWRGVQQCGFVSSPVSSNAHLAGMQQLRC